MKNNGLPGHLKKASCIEDRVKENEPESSVHNNHGTEENALQMINILRHVGDDITPKKQKKDTKQNLIIRKKHLKIKIMAAGKH